MPSCAFCQKAVDLEKPGRLDVCGHCDRDLHCCYQCQFYDENCHNECREPQAERVVDKEKANFCDYFVFEPQEQQKGGNKESARRQWEILFHRKK